MKIKEIIQENFGWELEPKRFPVGETGEIIIGMRRDVQMNVDGALFHYYDRRISTEPVFTMRVQNKKIYQYEHDMGLKEIYVGVDKSIEEVQKIFLDGVAKYLNMFIKEQRMEDKKITSKDILKVCPGLEEAMTDALHKSGLKSVTEAQEEIKERVRIFSSQKKRP